jgi:PAS domain S-box-containing protein
MNNPIQKPSEAKIKKKDLALGIKEIRKHVARLCQQAKQSSDSPKEVLDEALEELRTFLEELQIAEEELHIQHEQLIETRNEVETQRQRYQDLFEFAPDGYILTSVEGIILEANQAAASMLSIIQKFLLGKPLASFIDEEDRKDFRHKISQLYQTNVTLPEEIEARLRARDGRTLCVAMTVAAVLDHNGKPLAYRWLLRDITERKHAEEEIRGLNAELESRVAERTAELEAANRAKDELLVREQQARAEAEAANRSKDEFLATVSHEMRTPLNAILGWIHILRNQGLDSDKRAHALEVIDRNAKGQAQIVNDILEVSRIIAGNLYLEKRKMTLESVVESALDSVQHSAEARRISVTSSIHPVVGFVIGDANRLQQVVLNLLSNAIKFTPAGGRVHVGLERVDDSARIIVSDSGEGISPDFLPYIFERFRQADSASTRKHGGLGLGLSIAHHIVKMHGGRINAVSEGAGRGATFTVDLPLVNEDQMLVNEGQPSIETASQTGPAEMPLPAIAEPDLSGIWVIIIDDEQDAREMVRLVLQQWGARATALASVSEVIDTLAGEPGGKRPDILIADIAMPAEDGFDLIRKVRKLEPERGGTIPAIALTAYAATEDRLRVLSEGYQFHVPKPVSLVELASIVERLARN